MGRRVDVRPPLGRDRRRLRAHRDRRLVDGRRPRQRHVTVNIGEKGIAWRRLARAPARPATARCRSAPTTRSIKAAEVVRRLAEYRPAAEPRRHVAGPGRRDDRCPTSCRRSCSTPAAVGDAIAHAADTGRPRLPRAARTRRSRPTSPTAARRRTSIPDMVDIDVDIRTVPGTTRADVDAMLAEALGELAAARRDRPILQEGDPTQSPIGQRRCGTRWPTHTQVAYPGRRHRARASSSAAPTPASTATGARRLRRRAVLARARHGQRSAAASTATTSASTSRASAWRPTSGSASPAAGRLTRRRTIRFGARQSARIAATSSGKVVRRGRRATPACGNVIESPLGT